MCGIAGLALTNGPVDPNRLLRMRDSLRHRGPDGEGSFIQGNIGLGHRRLSIVDPAHGHQPMRNEDDSIVIVYNGEIYNHGDYRHDLEARGHRYRSHCDTETIIHLYEEHGDAVVEYLRGMFAFALWDGRRRKLLLARDRLGVKPLYYHHAADGSLVFGSEIKAILASGLIAPEVNVAALPDFLANHATSGTWTLFKGIKRLEPGHTLVWDRGNLKKRRYWDIGPAFDRSAPNRSDDDCVEEWSSLFEQSVRLRLMADVPLGVFLSGGIDSSAIASVMSSMIAEPVKTFSVAFAEREANELSYARLVAGHLKSDHHEVVVSPTSFFERLPDLVWHEDEPLAHPSSVALYFVSKLASDHVKVVLTGEGSDEMLGGYDRYRKTIFNLALGHKYHGMTNAAARRAINGTLTALPASLQRKLERTFLHLKPNLDELYFDNFAVFSRSRQAGLLAPELRTRTQDISPYSEMHSRLAELPGADVLDQLLYVDTHIYLQELLMKQDQMSMAASIESRVPFLDHKLCEFSAGLPTHLKIKGLATKRVLRKCMSDRLPGPILKRSKMGFPVPLARWFRGEFRHVIHEYVLGERACARGFFDRSYVAALVDSHMSGHADHAQRLWALVNFELWMRRFIDVKH